MRKIYYNGPIITMEKSGEIVTGLVEEDGYIVEVGDGNDLLKKNTSNIEKVDLNGAVLLPAFIDSHSHLSGVANSFLQIDLSECSTNTEIWDKITYFIKENNVREGEWVIGAGYDQNLLIDKKHPLHLPAELGENYPILLQHVSAHMGVFSSLAMKKLDINSGEVQHLQGVIEVIDGICTGYMEEEKYLYFLKKVPMPSMIDLLNAYEKAFDKYASYGITTVQEGMMVKELIPYYEQLNHNRMFQLDVIAYMGIEDSSVIEKAFPNAIKQYNNGFKINGYKMFLDGSPQGKTAWLKKPYRGEDSVGYPILEDEQVYANMKLAFGEKMQMIAHCNGDAAAEQFIIQHLKVLKAGEKEVLPTVMIHAQLLSREQMEKLHGIMPSFFCEHIYYWGDVHIKNLGLERAATISGTKSAKEMGVLFTLHQDSPVLEPDMMHTLWVACNRQTKAGVILGKNEKIDVYDALKAITINAAIQYGEENIKGTICKGKEANFVILDQNPLEVASEQLKNIIVEKTIKLGKVIYKK